MIRLALVALLVACGPGSKGGPAMNNRMNSPGPIAQGSEVVSGDILAREPVANLAQVKHILISWKDIESASDPRAQKRTKQEAEALVRSLMTQLKAASRDGSSMPLDVMLRFPGFPNYRKPPVS